MNEWYEYYSPPDRSEVRRHFSIRVIMFTTFLVGVTCAFHGYGLTGGDLVVADLYFITHALALYVFMVVLRKHSAADDVRTNQRR
jgi:uncharacterized membrane protein